MKDYTCAKEGLRYPGFSLVLIQMFALGEHKQFLAEDAIRKGMLSPINKGIDDLIFVMDENEKENIRRYRLKGFDFTLELEDPYPLVMKGHIFVEMMLLFGYTVSITYRILFDGEACTLSEAASTDHIIALLSTHLSAEYWSRNEGEEDTDINLEISNFKVSGMFLDKNGNILDKADEFTLGGSSRIFDEISSRYKAYIKKHCTHYPKKLHKKDRMLAEKEEMLQTTRHTHNDLHYAMVDIWENVSHPVEHNGDLFSPDRDTPMTEPEIVDHIKKYHKEELIGLMSLYPEEWPYRDPDAFDEVCGENIAIDTDDLVLVNSNICVVIGTYGRRGQNSPVDWAEHLQERSYYHVSWPEYLFILEMILAKKYIIDQASDQLVDTTMNYSHMNSTELIARNAALSIKITRMILQMNLVKYSKFTSHKVMFDRTTRRLDLDKDQDRLMELTEMVDSSFHNIGEYKSVKSDFLLNIILAIISIVSTFEILFQEINLPFLEGTGMESNRLAITMVWFVAALTVFGVLLVSINFLKIIIAKIQKFLR